MACSTLPRSLSCVVGPVSRESLPCEMILATLCLCKSPKPSWATSLCYRLPCRRNRATPPPNGRLSTIVASASTPSSPIPNLATPSQTVGEDPIPSIAAREEENLRLGGRRDIGRAHPRRTHGGRSWCVSSNGDDAPVVFLACSMDTSEGL